MKYSLEKNEDGAKIITVKKITMMQQCSTEQCSTEQRSTVDSKPTCDKLQNVSQSVSVSSLETVCLTTVKC